MAFPSAVSILDVQLRSQGMDCIVYTIQPHEVHVTVSETGSSFPTSESKSLTNAITPQTQVVFWIDWSNDRASIGNNIQDLILQVDARCQVDAIYVSSEDEVVTWTFNPEDSGSGCEFYNTRYE